MTESKVYKAMSNKDADYNIFNGSRLLGSFTGFDENENGLFMWLDSDIVDAVYIDDITRIVEI